MTTHRRGLRGAIAMAACVALSVVAASPAEAQGARREGFWWGVGVGGAYLDTDCERCDALPDSIPYGPGGGFQVGVMLGGTLSERLLVGVSGTTVARVAPDRDATVLGVGAVAQFYPAASGRLFLRAGAGGSVSILAGGGTLIEAVGLAGNLDVGLDLWRVGRLSLSPYLGVLLAANAEDSDSRPRDEPLGIGAPRNPRAVYVGASVMRY